MSKHGPVVLAVVLKAAWRSGTVGSCWFSVSNTSTRSERRGESLHSIIPTL